MSIMDGQINISMNARGVDSEIARLQKTIDNFGSRVTSTGKKTSDGVNQIGKGVKDAAYQVDGATTRMAQSILKQTVALESGGRQAAEYYRQMAQLNNLDSSFLNGYINRLEQAEKKNKSFADSINAVRVGIASTGAFIAGTGFVQLAKYSDLYTKIKAQVFNAASSQAEYNKNLADVASIAQQTQSPLEAVATLNSSLTRSLKDQGVEQTKINAITRNVALSLKAQGAEATQTGAVITQLSQAFASGVLRGDEFNSMAENAPLLQKALADSLGVSIGRLRSMAENGELTADKLVSAFGDGKLTKVLTVQAEKTNTLSGAWQVLKNEMLLSFGAIEDSIGFFERLAISTNQLGQGIGIIREYFKGDALKGLNDELKKTTDRLAAYDKSDPLTQLIVGGPETREKMIADMKRLSAEIRQLTAPAKPNPESLSYPAEIDKKWQDDFLKDFQAELEKRNKVAAESAKKLAELQREVSIEFYQDERERIEKLDQIKRDLFVDTIREENKRLDEKVKKEEKFAEYKRRLEEELNGTALKFLKMQEDAQQKTIERNAAEAQRQYERTQDILTREILNSLNRGFGKDGLSIAENFFQTLKNMAQSVVLEPAIRFVLNQTGITGLATTIGSIFTGQSSGAGLMPTTQNASIFERVTEGFKTINTTFTSSIEKLGVFLSNGQGGLADKIGGFLGQYSNQIASGIGYLSSAYMLSQGNIAGAALTAAGTYFLGPIGGAIGGALGSLFGGKVSTKKYSTGITGSLVDGKFTSSNQSGLAGYGRALGGNEGLAQVLKDYSLVVNSLFEAFDMGGPVNTAASLFQRSSKKTRAWGYFSANAGGGSVGFSSAQPFGSAQAAMEDLVNRILTEGITTLVTSSNLPEGVRMLFDGLSSKETIQSMIAASINLGNAQEALISKYSLTADQAGKVAVASGNAGDALATFVNSLSTTAYESLKTSEQMIMQRQSLNDQLAALGADASINSNLKAFDAFLKALPKDTAEAQKQFADLFNLRGTVGNVQTAWDQLMLGVNSSLYDLMSPAEQAAKDAAALNAMFAELGLAVPQSTAELAALGQTIQQNFNAADEASIDLALAFPTLVQAFTAAKDKVTETAREMNQFTSLSDFRFYKGVANNYGSDYANSYAGVSRFLGSNAQGETTLNGESVADLKKLLADLRDTTKQALVAQRATQSALEQIQARGLKTV